jgi:NhaP-type Na+/H+ or K+/H+ antiporter
VKRVAATIAALALALALALPSAAEARGNGWKDLLIGMGLGTGLGTTVGGATTMFIGPQYQQDFVFPLHYIYGAGIGLVVGTVGGALIGYLPEKPAKAGYRDPLAALELPTVAVAPIEVDPGRYEKAYFLYPVRLAF